MSVAVCLSLQVYVRPLSAECISGDLAGRSEGRSSRPLLQTMGEETPQLPAAWG